MSILNKALGIAGLVLLSYTNAEALPRNNYNFSYHKPSSLEVVKEPSIPIKCVIFNQGKTDVYYYHYPDGFLEEIDSVPETLENVSRLDELLDVPQCDKINIFHILR